MSDAFWAAVLALVAALLGVYKAWQADNKAAVVTNKLDDNTRTTEDVNKKADVLVKQTNGVTEALQSSVDQLLGRVADLERYNRESSHRVIDAVNAMHLKVAAMAAIQLPLVAQPNPGPAEPPTRGA